MSDVPKDEKQVETVRPDERAEPKQDAPVRPKEVRFVSTWRPLVTSGAANDKKEPPGAM
jgi:hypothetical protein